MTKKISITKIAGRIQSALWVEYGYGDVLRNLGAGNCRTVKRNWAVMMSGGRFGLLYRYVPDKKLQTKRLINKPSLGQSPPWAESPRVQEAL